jgi:hypothetical protein
VTAEPASSCAPGFSEFETTPENVAVRIALRLDAAEKRRSEEQPMKLGVGPATHASVTALRVVFQTAAVAALAVGLSAPRRPRAWFRVSSAERLILALSDQVNLPRHIDAYGCRRRPIRRKGGCPLEHGVFTAKPEIGRRDSSPRVRSARSVPFELATAVHAAMFAVDRTPTRGGSAGYEPKPDFPPCGIGRPPLR